MTGAVGVRKTVTKASIAADLQFAMVTPPEQAQESAAEPAPVPEPAPSPELCAVDPLCT
jgi:hypothetical protein